jgi:hypothetical protein
MSRVALPAAAWTAVTPGVEHCWPVTEPSVSGAGSFMSFQATRNETTAGIAVMHIRGVEAHRHRLVERDLVTDAVRRRIMLRQ